MSTQPESPIKSLLAEQKQLEPSLPTLSLSSELLSDISQKLKSLRDELLARHRLDLDENLLFLDISKEVLRVQSLVLFLSQGKPLLQPNKDEILRNLGGRKEAEAERAEEERKLLEHQEILKEYRKQLHSLRHQNRQLKKIAELYKPPEETAQSRPTKSVHKPKELEDPGPTKPSEDAKKGEDPRKSEKRLKSSERKAFRPAIHEYFELPELAATRRKEKRKREARPREIAASMERGKAWADNSRTKLQLETEIKGLDAEIEELTEQITQYL